jgi:hypothetical protein
MAKKKETAVVPTKQEPTTTKRTSYFIELLPKNVRPELNSSDDPVKNLIFHQISELTDSCDRVAESLKAINNLLGFDEELLTASSPKLQPACMEIFRAENAVLHANKCLDEAFDRIAEVKDEKAAPNAN